MSPQTWASTLALGIETGDIDAIEVVGCEDEVGKEESDEELQMHLVLGEEESGGGY